MKPKKIFSLLSICALAALLLAPLLCAADVVVPNSSANLVPLRRISGDGANNGQVPTWNSSFANEDGSLGRWLPGAGPTNTQTIITQNVTTNYITNAFITVENVTTNYITNAFITTAYITTNFVTYLTVQQTITTNLTVYDSVTIQTNLTVNQNVSVSGKATFNQIVITNGFFAKTNVWAGPTNTVDLSIYDQGYQTLTPVAITGFINYSNNLGCDVKWKIYNASSTNITVTEVAGLVDRDHVTSQTITNGTIGIFWFGYSPDLGGHTNCVFNDF